MDGREATDSNSSKGLLPGVVYNNQQTRNQNEYFNLIRSLKKTIAGQKYVDYF